MIRGLEEKNRNLDILINQEENDRAALVAELAEINGQIKEIIEERRVLEDECARIKANLDRANI